MSVLNFKYNNITLKKIDNINKNNSKIVNKINEIITNLPALNIVSDLKLLKLTTKIIKGFSKNKTDFVIFGTGGSPREYLGQKRVGPGIWHSILACEPTTTIDS